MVLYHTISYQSNYIDYINNKNNSIEPYKFTNHKHNSKDLEYRYINSTINNLHKTINKSYRKLHSIQNDIKKYQNILQNMPTINAYISVPVDNSINTSSSIANPVTIPKTIPIALPIATLIDDK